MKASKLIGKMALIAGLGLMASGSASAGAFFFNDTLAAWAAVAPPGVLDADGDSRWLYQTSSNLNMLNTVIIEEFQPGPTSAVEFYNLDLSRIPGADGLAIDSTKVSTLEYTVTSLDPAEPLSAASLDSVTLGNNAPSTYVAFKKIYDYSTGVKGTELLSLQTLNSARDPLSGATPFLYPTSAIYVVDTIGAGSVLEEVTNQFLIGIPEIDALAGTGALTLLAGALALAGERRRRSA
jgi:hypothetical protein